MEVGDDEVLTLVQAAERLQISPETLRTAIRRGNLNSRKIGRDYLITASEMRRYDERRKQPRGFAREDHPLHGKRGGGGRPKKDT